MCRPLPAAAGLPGSPIIFGCETRETGEIFKQRADGLFGLGNSEASGAPATVCRLPLPARPLTLLQPGTVRFHSFLLPPLMRPPASPDPTHPTLLLPLPAAPAVVNQLVKAGVIDDVFSICFGMVEGDGALLLGAAEVPGEFMLQYTPLLTSATHPFYYNVKMLSLAVDGQMLAVPQVRAAGVLRRVDGCESAGGTLHNEPRLFILAPPALAHPLPARLLPPPPSAATAHRIISRCLTRATAPCWTAAPPSPTCPQRSSRPLPRVSE